MKGALLLAQAFVACFSAVALISGCGGLVDLGGGSSNSVSGGTPPDAAASTYVDGNIRHVRMESVVESSWYCTGIAADDKYLYLMTGELGDWNAIRRCSKNNCAATLSRISGSLCSSPSCQVQAFERMGQRLVISYIAQPGGVRFDTCTLPDCADARTVIDKLPGSGTELALDEQRLYFTDLRDPAIYACALPDCAGGPMPFASGVSAQTFAADRGDLYWSAGSNRISRTRGDASASVEDFDVGPALGQGDAGSVPEAGGVGAAAEPVVFTSKIALGGDWLYANLVSSCNWGCAGSESLVRWPRDFSGPRQRLADGLEAEALRVFDDEIVFQRQGSVWSCRADDCAGTERVLDGAYLGVMAADDHYVYWCPNTPDGVRRAPRIAH